MKFLIKKAINISKVILISAIGYSLFLSSCKQSSIVEEQLLSEGWQIISSEEIDADGKVLSSGKMESKKWIDAKVPTTVLGALIEAGVYKEPFYAKNLADIPSEPFENPWWFRTQFSVTDFNSNKEQLRLFIDGINYRANFWLNGVQIASQDTLYGAFRQFEIDITNYYSDLQYSGCRDHSSKSQGFLYGFCGLGPYPTR